jgi:hypothetical protein
MDHIARMVSFSREMVSPCCPDVTAAAVDACTKANMTPSIISRRAHLK